jgi:glycolate oxidase iron-sulfur subunit
MLNTQQIISEADRCVACGLCLPHCPTYHKTGSEADSPRGRIQLMSAVAREILPANARFKQHIDLCLSCRSCESACPNGVNYGALIDTARAKVAKKPNLAGKAINHFIQSPIQMRLAAQMLRFIQKAGLLNVVGKLIPVLKKPITLLPAIPKPQTWCETYPTTEYKQGEVSLFLGCVSNAFDTDTLRASVFVLNRLGFEVHIPKKQTCCGSLARQQGNSEAATQLIDQNKNAFDAKLTTLTIASGCGAGLQDYSGLNIQDICAFLVKRDWSHIALQPLASEILVHDPCTLRNVQKSHASVYDVLKKIPHASISSLSGNSQCCGGAGAYMLTQADMATQLLNDKINAIQKTNAKLLATSNVGCALHIAAGLRAKSISVEVLHPVIIIAKQMGYTGNLV